MPPTIQEKYAAEFYPATTPKGAPALAVVCKRGYVLDEEENVLVPEDEPPVPSPEDKLFEGSDPLKSGPLREGDFVPFKPRTDVVVVATAYAPGGGAASRFDASVRVGEVEKRIHIVGPRTCIWQPPRVEKKGKQRKVTLMPPRFTDPKPVAKVAIRYEYAFGGVSVILPPDEEELQRLIQQAEAKEAEEAASNSLSAQAKARAGEQERRHREFLGEGEVQADGGAPGKSQGRPKVGRPDALDDPDPEGTDGAHSSGSTMILSRSELEPFPDRLGEPTGPSQQAEPIGTDPHALRLEDAGMVVEAESVLHLEAPPPQIPGWARDAAEEEDVVDAKAGDLAEFDDDWVADERRRKEEYLAGLPKAERPSLPSGLPKVYYPTNPAGRGYAATNDRRLVQGLELPLIEDPMRPITPEDVVRDPAVLHEQAVPAAGFTALGKPWLPRASFAGLPPEHIERARDAIDERIVTFDPEKPDERKQLEALLAYEPPQFDPRFYNGAAIGLSTGTLRGNEDVLLTQLTPDGKLAFQLPGDQPFVTVDRGRGPEPVGMRLDTVWIDVEKRRLEMAWRGHLNWTGPEEMADYPHLRLEIEDRKLTDYVERITAKRKEEDLSGDTMILTPDDLAAIRALDAEQEAARAAAQRDEAPKGPKYLWTVEDEEGARIEELVADRDVLHTDDSWIEALKRGVALTEDEQVAQSEENKRAARKAKKAELTEKLAQIRKAEEEAALAKAKNKKT